MTRILAVIAVAVGLSGCMTVSDFLGSKDPCGAANNIHASFMVALATNPDKLGKYARKERAAFASVMEYCASGDVSKPTLQRLVGAYAAAIADYKASN